MWRTCLNVYTICLWTILKKYLEPWTHVEAFSTSHTCQMWRNFRFLHIFHMAKFEITPHVEKFQISPHLSRIEIWNFSTWQIFLHMSGRWYRWQISGMINNYFVLLKTDVLFMITDQVLPLFISLVLLPTLILKYIHNGRKMKPIMMNLLFVTTLAPNAPCVSQSLMNLKLGTTALVLGYQATDSNGMYPGHWQLSRQDWVG